MAVTGVSVDAKLGNERRFYLTSDTEGSLAGASPVWLAGEQTNTFNRTQDSIEVSDKASGNWKKFISGMRSATADVTVYADDKDEQQKKVIDAFYEGQTVFCFVGEVTGEDRSYTASSGEAFEAIVTAVNDTNNQNEVASRQMSLQATGEVVRIGAAAAAAMASASPEPEPEPETQEEQA